MITHVHMESVALRKSAFPTAKKPRAILGEAGQCKPESPRSKRRQIVQAALKVFLKYGYEGTSISKVAETAGVIKATIYSHFEDKQALFRAIIESITVENAFEEFDFEGGAMEPSRFFEWLAAKMDERRRDRQFQALIRLVIGESGRFPELAALFYETVSLRSIRIISKFLQQHPELKIVDPEAAAHVIAGSMVYWIISQELLGGKKINSIGIERIAGTLKHLFVDASPRS